MTTKKPKKHNLQIQANKQSRNKTVKKIAPRAVSSVLVHKENPQTAKMIISELVKNYKPL